MASQQDGNREANMEWMYKPSTLVNRDDYLLGRSIDKSFHLLESVEKEGDFNYADEVEKDLTPLSIFAPTRSGPVDVIKKIKEDPLYQIQKKEEEHLKELLKNPVRMKEVRQIKDAQERKRRLSESSASNKHKKHSSSSRSRNELNEAEIEKRIREKHHNMKYSSSSSSSSMSRRVDEAETEKRFRDRDHKEKPSSRSRTQRDDPEIDKHNREKHHKNHSNSSSSNRKQLNEVEIDKRLREMMENAKWRDDQRTKNVMKYREAAKKEDEEIKSGHNADFIRKQLLEAASTGSVEKRIKSNAYNIQKSSSSMNTNFARR